MDELYTILNLEFDKFIPQLNILDKICNITQGLDKTRDCTNTNKAHASINLFYVFYNLFFSEFTPGAGVSSANWVMAMQKMCPLLASSAHFLMTSSFLLQRGKRIPCFSRKM